MCGIAGIARASRAPVDRETLERMCEAQVHRGPDARGLHLAEGVGLGIQRLRVIDLVTGDQPIHNEDRTVTVVLNGEIYNFRELRRRLRANGHRLATDGDTEVIVHLYEELGPDCVRELHGMFAFALWDSRRHQLLLARDRVGKKPLFYSERDGAVSFASELAALMQDPEVPREIDHQALDAYLAYGCVPAPLSAFARGAQVDAGQHPRLPRRAHPHRALLASGLLTEASRAAGGGAARGDSRHAPAGRAAADGRGRSHRRLPVGRDRLFRGRGGDGRELAPPGEDLLDRLRGGALQRAPARRGWSPSSSRPTTTS